MSSADDDMKKIDGNLKYYDGISFPFQTSVDGNEISFAHSIVEMINFQARNLRKRDIIIINYENTFD